MRFPPKLVSVLCSMQVFVIGLTWVLVGGFRKALHVATAGWNPPFPYPLGLHVFFWCGPSLLLIPLIWGYLATTRAEIGHGFAVISERQGWIGWAITATMLLFCGYMIFQAFIWSVVVPFTSL